MAEKQGYLRPGTVGSLSWSWRDEQTGFINYRMEIDRVVLVYRYRAHGGEWEPVEQISFDRAPCNYGGFRTWFLCPHCRRRVALIYGAGKYFLKTCTKKHLIGCGKRRSNLKILAGLLRVLN
ncbi:MAG: hypothetical protein J7M30_06220 [Deltaproteobacteria bacterium]|nr:hypothetical protein [Deltaproteobacteria bacterium]